jgi:AcrR family transcriptional regulator
MTERLSARDWLDFGLKVFSQEGVEGLKADALARKMGVSRGSFYWHFEDLADFQERLIGHWKTKATEAIIAHIEQFDSPKERMDSLLRQAFGHVGSLEVRMRTWAANNAAAAKAVKDIDRRRLVYLEKLLLDSGVSPQLAATRAQVLYWAYLGASLSGDRLDRAPLDLMLSELGRIGFGDIAAADPGITAKGRRSRRGYEA